jgi:hypothetical protein
MSRPPRNTAAKAAAKQQSWAICRLKGTPAKLLGNVETPDEGTAIWKAIGEFNVAPELQRRLLAQRRP